MNSMTGQVAFGANNIFSIVTDEGAMWCRIKGKVLREDEASYNPLAPGDMVRIVPDRHSPGEGQIVERLERHNSIVRWNRKRQKPQTIAANIDLLLCISSAMNPPFRPRFIDRVLIAAADIPVTVVLNKIDLGVDPEVEQRIEDYRRIGIDTVKCSVHSGEGIAAVSERTQDRKCAFFGQSGVGKSSLINRLYPGLDLEVGTISSKYDRGRHVTKNSVLIEHERGGVIDTPGIRQLELALEGAAGLDEYFHEFLPYISQCSFQPCTHMHEPDCAVKQAVEQGTIHPDRYESYIRIFLELEARREYV